METLVDLVARDRRSDRPALRTAERELDYRRFCTTAWKASNFLRHLGVAPGRTVAVAAVPSPQPVLTLFGAALLGAPTRLTTEPARVSGARVVLVPADREADIDPDPGTKLVVFGDEPAAATTEYWEGGVWSENPAFAPPGVAPDEPVLLADERAVSHADLLGAGRRVVDSLALEADHEVDLRASLADPRAVAAGVVAPLLVGACARLSGGSDGDVRLGDDVLSLNDVTV